MENELYHYGVPGMRWGVRRARSSSVSTTGRRKKTGLSGFLSKKTKSRSSSKPKVSTGNKGKTLSEMSDAELQQRINRLQMEQRYKDLQPKKISRGKKIVNSVVNKMFVPAAEDVGKQLMKSGMTKAVNTAFGLEGDYAISTNNKKK